MSRGTALKPGVLPTLLGYRLRRAQQAVFHDFAASVAEISPGRAGMLLLIDANPGVTQGSLAQAVGLRSEEHTSELQSQSNLVCRLLLEKKNKSLIRVD